MSGGTSDLAARMRALASEARRAARSLASASTEAKDRALQAAADAILAREKIILESNRVDLEAARAAGQNEAFLDRLRLDPKRLAAIAAALREVASLPDPVGRETARWKRPKKESPSKG